MAVGGAESRCVSSNADKRGIGEKIKRLKVKRQKTLTECGIWNLVCEKKLWIQD